MTKKDFISAVAEKTGLTKKDAEAALNATLAIIGDELAAGGEVQFTGFGTFCVKERAARQGKNPQTGEIISIPAGKAPAFKAGKALKDAVAK